MKYLLDTCALIYMAFEPDRLSLKHRDDLFRFIVRGQRKTEDSFLCPQRGKFQ